MKISLENYLRNKIDEVESMHSYELATDTIRCWIDEYNEQLRLSDVVGRSEQLPPNSITDKEHKDLMKALYPKDNSKRFRR